MQTMTGRGAMEEHLIGAYGKAMQRLGELERENEMLRSRAATDGGKAEAFAAKDKVIAELRDRISQLDTQLALTNAQLKRAEERYRQAAAGNLSRHRRSHRKPWWQFWGKRRASGGEQGGA